MGQLYLFTGGSASGKSAHAEDFLCRRAPGSKLYLATMEPFGKEAHARIARHRKLRAGKGFLTGECYRDLAEFRPDTHFDGILLEDLGNLMANHLFALEPQGAEETLEAILTGIETLQTCCDTLTLVTNEVGRDGLLYPPETITYIQTLSRLNTLLLPRCDGAWESVCGILIPLKGGPAF